MSSFKQCLPALARMTAMNAGLKVIFGSPTPCTDGKTIWYPSIPLGEVTADTRALFNRWNDHEAIGHGCFTDFSVITKHISTFEAQPQLKTLLNSLEDPRIEVQVIKRYKGSDRILREGLRVMAEQKQIKETFENPADALSMYVCHWGRLFLLGHTEVEPYFDTVKEALTEHLEEKGLNRLDALLSCEYTKAKSTNDCFVLAQDIIKLIEDIAEEQKNENEQDENDSGDAGQDDSESDDNTQSGGGGSDDKDDDDKGDSSPSDSDSDDNNGEEGEGDSSPSSSNANNNEENDDGNNGESDDDKSSGAQAILDADPSGEEAIDTTGALQQSLEENEDIPQDGRRAGYGASPQPHSDQSASAHIAREDKDLYDFTKSDLTSQIGTLRQRLVSLVQSKTRRRKQVTTKGKLSGKHLHRAKVGNPNFRRKKVDTVLPVAAVSVLCDMSGSMGQYGKEQMAQQTLIAIAEACNAIGTPLELLGFGGYIHHPAGLVEIKPFSMSYASARKRLGGYVLDGGGVTPLGEGLFEAALSLSQQNAQRKLMLVLADGDADNPAYAKEMVRLIEAEGIEIVGVGIKTDSVKGLFKRWSVVHDINNLAVDVLKIIENSIVSDAA